MFVSDFMMIISLNLPNTVTRHSQRLHESENLTQFYSVAIISISVLTGISCACVCKRVHH